MVEAAATSIPSNRHLSLALCKEGQQSSENSWSFVGDQGPFQLNLILGGTDTQPLPFTVWSDAVSLSFSNGILHIVTSLRDAETHRYIKRIVKPFTTRASGKLKPRTSIHISVEADTLTVGEPLTIVPGSALTNQPHFVIPAQYELSDIRHGESFIVDQIADACSLVGQENMDVDIRLECASDASLPAVHLRGKLGDLLFQPDEIIISHVADDSILADRSIKVYETERPVLSASADSSTVNVRRAFWRVESYKSIETEPSVYRLCDAQGYDSTVHETANVALSDSADEPTLATDPTAPPFVDASQLDEQHAGYVFQDLGFGFAVDKSKPWASKLARVKDEGGFVVAVIDRTLESCVSPPDTGSIWMDLRDDQQLRVSTIVILSAHVLRGFGCRISHRISLERTAQECVKAFTHPQLAPLVQFGHVIVRIGVAAALYIQNNGTFSLHYDPEGRCDPDSQSFEAFYRDPNEHGRVVGNNSVFAASLVAELFTFGIVQERNMWNTPEVSAALGSGIDFAIHRSQTLHELGYGTPAQFADHSQVVELEFDAARRVFADDPAQATKPIGEVSVLANQTWSILEESAQGKLYQLACQIAYSGISTAFNPPADNNNELFSIVAPVVRFGKMITFDRSEIESFRNVDSIIREYRRDKERTKPLSIAVFGPPGSGKSFGVEQVARGIFGAGKYKLLKYNLAQFSSPDDLATPFLEIKNNTGGDLPLLVFFDEFDCRLGDEELGWLRFFLAPMEDGKFKHGEQMLDLSKVIFVFAGGTSQAFQEFAGHFSQQPTAMSEAERLNFVKAKGPDFISRLAGHIDTVGINPKNETDSNAVVRRAIQLRANLEQRNLVGASGRAMIYPALIEALLRTPRFTHGSRSLRIVLENCITPSGMVKIPSIGQLNMHVDGGQFLKDYEEALRHPVVHPGVGVMNGEYGD